MGKTKKPMVKTSRSKRKSLKMLYSPLLLSCINKVVDHLQVEKKEKTRLTKTSYNLNIVLTKTFFTVIRLFLGHLIISGNILYKTLLFYFSYKRIENKYLKIKNLKNDQLMMCLLSSPP